MATYYVAASGGNNSNDGLSQGNAWATLAHAVSTVTTTGDEIIALNGTHTVDNYLVVAAGVSLKGESKVSTILVPGSNIYHNDWIYEPWDKYMIQVGTLSAGRGVSIVDGQSQVIGNFRIQGGHKIQGGVGIFNRSNVVLEDYDVIETYYGGFAAQGVRNCTFRRINVNDCSPGKIPGVNAVRGGIPIGDLENCTFEDIYSFETVNRQITIADMGNKTIYKGGGPGLQLTWFGYYYNDPASILTDDTSHKIYTTDFVRCQFDTDNPVSQWVEPGGGTTPNICMELFQADVQQVRFIDCEFNAQISLVDPFMQNSPAQYAVKILRSKFNPIAGVAYPIELSMNKCEIFGCEIKGGTTGYPIFHTENNNLRAGFESSQVLEDTFIHENVFYNINPAWQTSVIQGAWGISGLDFYSNTVELSGHWATVFSLEGPHHDNLRVRNNLFIRNGAGFASTAPSQDGITQGYQQTRASYHGSSNDQTFAGSIGTVLVDKNNFYGMAAGVEDIKIGVQPSSFTEQNNTTQNPVIQGGSAYPEKLLLDVGSPLLGAGLTDAAMSIPAWVEASTLYQGGNPSIGVSTLDVTVSGVSQQTGFSVSSFALDIPNEEIDWVNEGTAVSSGTIERRVNSNPNWAVESGPFAMGADQAAQTESLAGFETMEAGNPFNITGWIDNGNIPGVYRYRLVVGPYISEILSAYRLENFTNLLLSEEASNSVKFSWRYEFYPTDGDKFSFVVQYKASSSGTWVTRPAIQAIDAQYDYETVIDGLIANTSYDFRVKAVFYDDITLESGESPYTSTSTTSTLQAGGGGSTFGIQNVSFDSVAKRWYFEVIGDGENETIIEETNINGSGFSQTFSFTAGPNGSAPIINRATGIPLVENNQTAATPGKYLLRLLVSSTGVRSSEFTGYYFNTPTISFGTINASYIRLNIGHPSPNGSSAFFDYEISRSLDGGSNWSVLGTVAGTSISQSIVYDDTDLQTIGSNTVNYRVRVIYNGDGSGTTSDYVQTPGISAAQAGDFSLLAVCDQDEIDVTYVNDYDATPEVVSLAYRVNSLTWFVGQSDLIPGPPTTLRTVSFNFSSLIHANDPGNVIPGKIEVEYRGKDTGVVASNRVICYHFNTVSVAINNVSGNNINVEVSMPTAVDGPQSLFTFFIERQVNNGTWLPFANFNGVDGVNSYFTNDTVPENQLNRYRGYVAYAPEPSNISPYSSEVEFTGPKSYAINNLGINCSNLSYSFTNYGNAEGATISEEYRINGNAYTQSNNYEGGTDGVVTTQNLFWPVALAGDNGVFTPGLYELKLVEGSNESGPVSCVLYNPVTVSLDVQGASQINATVTHQVTTTGPASLFTIYLEARVPGGTWAQVGEIVGVGTSDTTLFLHQNLSAGTIYEYRARVRYTAATEYSDYSPVVSATTDSGACTFSYSNIEVSTCDSTGKYELTIRGAEWTNMEGGTTILSIEIKGQTYTYAFGSNDSASPTDLQISDLACGGSAGVPISFSVNKLPACPIPDDTFDEPGRIATVQITSISKALCSGGTQDVTVNFVYSGATSQQALVNGNLVSLGSTDGAGSYVLNATCNGEQNKVARVEIVGTNPVVFDETTYNADAQVSTSTLTITRVQVGPCQSSGKHTLQVFFDYDNLPSANMILLGNTFSNVVTIGAQGSASVTLQSLDCTGQEDIPFTLANPTGPSDAGVYDSPAKPRNTNVRNITKTDNPDGTINLCFDIEWAGQSGQSITIAGTIFNFPTADGRQIFCVNNIDPDDFNTVLNSCFNSVNHKRA